ncbi:MAG: DUF3102 domain-containing protein [Nannocystaceae bacterium]|nr:DUF3102 domain-containing protein [bacterium]
MARPRKKLAKRSARRSPARRTPAASSDLAATESTEHRLTREILELDRRSKARVVADVVAIGQRMQALQRHLGFGQWLSWLSAQLPFSPRTAQRYIAVARWAEEFPDDYEHFAGLGLGKLQLLAGLTPAQRARFRSQQRFQIPGTRTRKTLALMTHEQLDRVIRGMNSLTARPPTLPPTKLLQRFRHRLAGLDVLADSLRANADALPAEEVEEAAEELEALLEEVRSMLP